MHGGDMVPAAIGLKRETGVGLPLTIRPATGDDAGAVARIYVESWNAGFGGLLSRADRTVNAGPDRTLAV